MIKLESLFLILALSLSPVLVFAEEKTISVDYGKLYEIAYNAKDVTVFDVIPNSDEKELIFDIDVTSPIATLELTIPRELLDSTENGNDVDFFLIADGELVTFSEKKATDTARTLFMQLSPGTTNLEVFGTELAGTLSENKTVEEPKDKTTEETTQPEQTPTEPAEEQTPVESVPEEKPTAVSVEKPSQDTTQNMFDFSKIPNWSIPINERQMQEFAMTAGAFVALIIILVIFRGSRLEKDLP
ncbi:MAG: hypothetical protein AABZ49_04905 [Thermoproteota archaeon]